MPRYMRVRLPHNYLCSIVNVCCSVICVVHIRILCPLAKPSHLIALPSVTVPKSGMAE